MTIETAPAGTPLAEAPRAGTPLGRVRALGPAREGAHHWGLERATSVATLVLLLWFFVSLLRLPSLDHGTVSEWLQGPLAAAPMLLLVVATFWHLKLGLIVVIEDYVHEEGNRLLSILFVNFAAIFAATLALFAVLKIALAGGTAA